MRGRNNPSGWQNRNESMEMPPAARGRGCPASPHVQQPNWEPSDAGSRELRASGAHLVLLQMLTGDWPVSLASLIMSRTAMPRHSSWASWLPGT